MTLVKAWLPVNNYSEGMRAAEAAEPGFVQKHGWIRLECNDCKETIYDGRLISPSDAEELGKVHGYCCKAFVSWDDAR